MTEDALREESRASSSKAHNSFPRQGKNSARDVPARQRPARSLPTQPLLPSKPHWQRAVAHCPMKSGGEKRREKSLGRISGYSPDRTNRCHKLWPPWPTSCRDAMRAHKADVSTGQLCKVGLKLCGKTREGRSLVGRLLRSLKRSCETKGMRDECSRQLTTPAAAALLHGCPHCVSDGRERKVGHAPSCG